MYDFIRARIPRQLCARAYGYVAYVRAVRGAARGTDSGVVFHLLGLQLTLRRFDPDLGFHSLKVPHRAV